MLIPFFRLPFQVFFVQSSRGRRWLQRCFNQGTAPFCFNQGTAPYTTRTGCNNARVCTHNGRVNHLRAPRTHQCALIHQSCMANRPCARNHKPCTHQPLANHAHGDVHEFTNHVNGFAVPGPTIQHREPQPWQRPGAKNQVRVVRGVAVRIGCRAIPSALSTSTGLLIRVQL